MKKYLLCIFIIISLLCFNGCSLFEEYYPEEELFVRSGFDTHIYQYSGDVKIYDGVDHSDSLVLRNEDGEFGKELFIDSYTILEGHFQFFAWNDFKLFILKNGLFYVFDIKSYSYPPVDDDGNETFEFSVYTKEDFKALYPDYQSYDWVKCTSPENFNEDLNTERTWIVNSHTPFSIPENAILREYTEYTEDIDGKNLIKGKISICTDRASLKFDELLMNTWINPIKDDKYFDKLNKYVFEEDFLVYNDDFYYFYDNEKIGDKDTDTYYHDYLKIFAYDAERMILYFYICY